MFAIHSLICIKLSNLSKLPTYSIFIYIPYAIRTCNNTTNNILVGTSTTLYDDTPNFELSNFPSRGSSYHVISGGWVLYSEPNYQGKILIHFAGNFSWHAMSCQSSLSSSGECISNDPVVSGEGGYKPWSGQFGSARPLRGLNYR